MRVFLASLFVCWCLFPLSAEAQQHIAAERLLAHVEVLAHDSLQGRDAGTEGAAMARAYLRAQLAGLGLQTFEGGMVQRFTFPHRRAEEEREGVNLMAYIEGQVVPDTFIVVTAHYDHLGVRAEDIYNGADDNASGTAALLEAARHFAQHPTDYSLLLLFLDAEEHGLRGARAFVADPPVEREQLRLNVNMDMISRSPANELYAVGTHHYPRLRPVLEAVGARHELQLLFGHDQPDHPAQDDWTLASDHAPFHEAGIPFVYFGVEDHPGYHDPSDTFDHITPDFFVQAAELVLDALRDLDAQLPTVAPNVTK
ncbi:MAG: M20/M25/M40 family metallo-hydrolase [Bacteroidetes bacterium]|jgi:Zn-dependent M28 family amino/carboxypeptidase|nr:M20/M25/M40 family metallo-hydrolase [Bacteroidota bacterium]